MARHSEHQGDLVLRNLWPHQRSGCAVRLADTVAFKLSRFVEAFERRLERGILLGTVAREEATRACTSFDVALVEFAMPRSAIAWR